MKIREKIQQFMYGRYGNDSLGKFLVIAGLVLYLLGTFIAKLNFLRIPAIVLLIFAYYRMFSKNIAKRQSENAKFCSAKNKLFVYLKNIKERWVQRKDFKFYTCPSCKATLRVPKGRGKIKIVCRKCGNSFLGKS